MKSWCSPRDSCRTGCCAAGPGRGLVDGFARLAPKRRRRGRRRPGAGHREHRRRQIASTTSCRRPSSKRCSAQVRSAALLARGSGRSGTSRGGNAGADGRTRRPGRRPGRPGLGCGWGSLALWAAERYPHSRVLAVSNSHAQGRFVEAVRDRRGLKNLEVVTTEVGGFEPDGSSTGWCPVGSSSTCNHEELLRRISGWLKPGGLLFVHVFCHRRFLYAFEPEGPGGWMAERFFSGGMMPSYELPAEAPGRSGAGGAMGGGRPALRAHPQGLAREP